MDVKKDLEIVYAKRRAERTALDIVTKTLDMYHVTPKLECLSVMLSENLENWSVHFQNDGAEPNCFVVTQLKESTSVTVL